MNTPTARAIVEKLTLALVVAIAAMFGLAPASFFFKTPNLLFYFAAEGALVSGVYFFAGGHEDPSTYRPGLLECVFVGFGSVSLWGSQGFLCLMVYGLVYWAARLIGLVVSWFGGKGTIDAASIALYVSVVLTFIFAIGVALLIAQKVTHRLYSNRARLRSASYHQALQRQSRTFIYLALSVLALGIMTVGLWTASEKRGFWFYFFLQLVPYYSGAWLLNLGARARKDSDVVGAVGKLLMSADYQVIFSPHSQDTTANTLLSGLDMIAFKHQNVFIVKVKTQSGSSVPVEWTLGSSLQIKARALQLCDVRGELQIPSMADSMKPLIVLAGRQPAESLLAFSHEELCPVVVIEMEVIDRVLEIEDADELQMLAQKYFQNIEAPVGDDAVVPERALITEGV